MINKILCERIENIIPGERLFYEEPMSRHTSFRIGGPAALLVQINTETELASIMGVLAESDGEHMLIGNGSNLLVSDEGYPGIVLKLGGDFEKICMDDEDDCLVHVGAARLMSGVSSYLADAGLSGFEFAGGIPGSIGGAVFMNAGAYGGEMKDIVECVRVMYKTGAHDKDSGEAYSIRVLSNKEMSFSYRHSRIQDEGGIILSVMLRLTRDDSQSIRSRIAELAEKRNSKQPLNYPSAGSTFKRPAGGYAAALIEEAGLKGYRVGGASVSEKHSGFVINDGAASCEDVISVMRHVQKTVFDKSGIMLEPEVRLINCEL